MYIRENVIEPGEKKKFFYFPYTEHPATDEAIDKQNKKRN